MLTNRKIRKMFKKELEPPMPFDEFCEKAGIEFKPEQPTGKKSKWRLPIIFTAAVSAVVVCGCIPLMLPKDKAAPSTPLYGYNDVYYTPCDLSFIQSDASVIMYNTENSQQMSGSFAINPKDNSQKCLGYSLQNVVYGQETDSEVYAFEFDYLIRTYKSFEFLGAERYKNLSERFDCGGVEYKYEINTNVAHMTFRIDNNDYFILLRSYEGITEIDNDSVETFVQMAFGKDR